MGITRSELFSAHQNEIAMIAKAIGHPARVAILEFLMKSDSCICNDIVGEVGLAQPTVSQHLKELKSANIIQGNIEGKAICYCLNKGTLDKIKDYFSSICSCITDNGNCC